MTALTLLVHLATYGPDQIGSDLFNAALVLFALVFPVGGATIVMIGFGGVSVDRLFATLPRYLIIVQYVFLVYLFVDFFLMMRLLPGNPEQDGSRFFFDNHGYLIPIDADQYRMGLMHSTRLVTSIELFFCGFASLVGFQLQRIRAGRIDLDVVPRDETVERSPLPYPLSRVLTLQTALSPEDCAARLMTPLQRPAWSLFAVYQGLRGQACPSEFRVELASAHQSQMVYAVGRFEGAGGPTSIRLLLTFKKAPLLSIAITLILIPVVWAALVAFGFPFPWFVVAAVIVFVVVGNLLFGLDQRRRLLVQIKRATEAQEVSSA